MEHLESYAGHFTEITKNAARCKLCDDVIVSKHRHDFVTCKCGEISTDGGTAYIRRLANNLSNIEDRSTFRTFTVEEIAQVKFEANKNMRDSPYSTSYYANLIKAAEYFAYKWYACKI